MLDYKVPDVYALHNINENNSQFLHHGNMWQTVYDINTVTYKPK